MDLIERFAADVGPDGPVTIRGAATRGGAVAGVRSVVAPAGITAVEPEEMIMVCGAATPLDEIDNALAEVGQRTVLTGGGTVGGALSVGQSGIRRLGDGAIRDALLRTRYVSADGEVVTAGGQTVKNVSGFDLCRLLVGARGTLGFMAEVTLRTRPRPPVERWFVSTDDPRHLQVELYRPVSLLWDGTTTYALLAGHGDDVEHQARRLRLEAGEPPTLPTGGRVSVPPGELPALTGRFVVELGVGVVHCEDPAPRPQPDAAVVELHRRIKDRFDPTGRLNPGVDVLT